MLPTFVVIGAGKSGTTSLYHYLAAHPDVAMSRVHEPRFFSGQTWDRGLPWYERQFAHGRKAAARGDCTPGYSMHPLFTGVPERMAAVIPDARLVYLVRHPVRRMVSHYHHRVGSSREHDPIDRALLENPHYLNTSRYAHQIEQYLEHFPAERLLVVTSENLKRDRSGTMALVYGFVGVDPEGAHALEGREHNVTAGKQRQRKLVKRAMRIYAVRAATETIPLGVRQVLRRATHLQPPVASGALSPEVERELEDRLREDVARLRPYVSGEFDGWGLA